MNARGTQDQPRRRRGLRTAVVALLVGLIAGIVLVVLVGGNPLSSTNEVRYLDVTVGSIGEQQDSLCWSTDPSERDASRQCAILALDPQTTVPQEGERVTIGLADIAPPGQESRSQIVYAGPAGASPTSSPTQAGVTEPAN